MGGPLFLVFLLAIPFIEIALFIQVGKAIGVFETILLTLAISAAGFFVVQKHSMQTAIRVRESLARGQPPVKEMFDNACVVVGGFLMILPGFFTDVIGLVLLLPPVHDSLRGYLERHGSFQAGMRAGGGTAQGSGAPFRDGGRVIDGEFVEVVEEDPAETGSASDPGAGGSNPWGRLDRRDGSGPDRTGGGT